MTRPASLQPHAVERELDPLSRPTKAHRSRGMTRECEMQDRMILNHSTMASVIGLATSTNELERMAVGLTADSTSPGIRCIE